MQANRLAFVVLVAAGSAATLAQESTSDPAPLAGPEVVNERPPLIEQGLTMAERVPGSMRMGQIRQIRADDLRTMLQELGSVRTDHAIRLRRDQHAAIESLNHEHRQAVRAYRAEHAERYAELQKQAGTGEHAPRVEPGAEPQPRTPAQQEARKQIRALDAAGPSVTVLQTRIFAELDPSQQAWLADRIEARQIERERADRQRRYLDELSAEPVTIERFLNEQGGVDLAALPPRLRDRFERMPERRRRPALEAFFLDAPGDAGQPGRDTTREPAGSPGLAKPAPPIEAVEVPNPDTEPDTEPDSDPAQDNAGGRAAERPGPG